MLILVIMLATGHVPHGVNIFDHTPYKQQIEQRAHKPWEY